MNKNRHDRGHREAVARSLYTMLTKEGFSPEQVVGLANELLGLVARDLNEETEVVAEAK